MVGWFLWHINLCRLFNAKFSLYICIKNVWFGLVWFYDILTIVGYLMSNPLYTYILNIYDLILWHINHCRLFNAKSFLYIWIYIWFVLVGFYGISTIEGYLMPNPLSLSLSIYLSIYLYIYIKYIWFVLVEFYGISTIVGYLIRIISSMSNNSV